MKKLILTSLLVSLASLPSVATLYSTNWSSSFVNGTTIPDNNPAGWSDTRSLTGFDGVIQDIRVTLNLANGWNGDLYAYLVHGDGFAVLLDRVGWSGSGAGYGNPGFDVTLGPGGSPIESYQSHSPQFNGTGQLLGEWAAHSGLDSFLGLDPNGSWSLFIADLSGGGVTTVQSWGLQMDIVAVPEVETWVAAALAGLFGAFWLNRQIWDARRPQ